MLPSYVLIIGAMKCGTTTLFDYLARHPQIAASRYKEVGFFAFEEKWALGFDWYEQHFNFDPTKHLYGLEASTDYTKYPFCTGVAERMAAAAPRRFKLIYVMRHPLRRIESHARHTDRMKEEVGRCTSPRADHSLDCGVSPVSLAATMYAQQLDQFDQFYKDGDLFLLTTEALAADPAPLLMKICSFLDLDPDIQIELDVKNRSGPVYETHPAWTALSRIHMVNRAVKTILPQNLRSILWQRSRVEIPLRGRYKLHGEEESALLSDLQADLRRLRDKYGIDVERQWGVRI